MSTFLKTVVISSANLSNNLISRFILEGCQLDNMIPFIRTTKYVWTQDFCKKYLENNFKR